MSQLIQMHLSDFERLEVLVGRDNGCLYDSEWDEVCKIIAGVRRDVDKRNAPLSCEEISQLVKRGMTINISGDFHM